MYSAVVDKLKKTLNPEDLIKCVSPAFWSSFKLMSPPVWLPQVTQANLVELANSLEEVAIKD